MTPSSRATLPCVHLHIIARARLLKFLQRRHIMIPRCLQRRSGLRFIRLCLPLPQHPKHSAEIVLRRGPIQRPTLASPLLKRCAIG